MFRFFKRKKKAELPPKDELDLIIEKSLQTVGILDIQTMIKEALANYEIKDVERMERVLIAIKPEIEKAVKEGRTYGQVTGIPLDKILDYSISTKIYNKLQKNHGIDISVTNNGVVNYQTGMFISKATEVIIGFNLYEVKNER